MRYLLCFANEHVNFRLPEIKSLLSMFHIDMKCHTEELESPFWEVELPSESDARLLASRSICLRSILRLWGSSTSLSGLHDQLKQFPFSQMEPYIGVDKSFRVDVTTFNRTFTMQEKVNKIELFNYLPAHGPVSLKTPDTILHYIEYYGLDTNRAPEIPFHRYFGVWICDGQRSKIHQLSLKTRKFIGNTSMDAQLSLIMANQAQVKEGDLVFDPFVGSGSLLVAAASFGGTVLGADIDYLMLHGRTKPTRKQTKGAPRLEESVLANLQQYDLSSKYLDIVVADSSLPLWHDRLKFEAIITDPPYGIREATERIGSTRQYTISAVHAPTHIPSKVEYNLKNIYADLLQFAADRLVMNGRLVTWIPIETDSYSEEQIPQHPALLLVSNSEQLLSAHTSRRLLTWEKINDTVTGPSEGTSMQSPYSRHHYFCHGESRQERRKRKIMNR